METLRLQSAMEYLMTYGWAIFIIAAVAVSISYLLFSGTSSNLISPKATPGGCFVQISYQNGNLGFSRTNRNLVGQCNNELPEYVAQISSGNSQISIKSTPALSISSEGTFIMWVEPNPSWPASAVFLDKSYGNGAGQVSYRIQRYLLTNNLEFYDGSNVIFGGNIIPNSWTFIAVTIYNGNIIGYINGAEVFATSSINNPLTQIPSANILIGSSPASTFTAGSTVCNCNIANVQLYNTSLSQSDIMQLYDEGIGGTPIAIQNLAGWWPLNGNANDYSGINNNGNAINVNYTTTWSSGYSQPQNTIS